MMTDRILLRNINFNEAAVAYSDIHMANHS